MPIYLTEYPCGGGTFCSYIVAKNKAAARKLITLRGLQEAIIGYARRRPSEMRCRIFYERGEKVKCAHTLCFVGNILCNAGIMQRAELLDDTGILHELLHQMEDDASGEGYLITRPVMVEVLRAFDAKARKIGF